VKVPNRLQYACTPRRLLRRRRYGAALALRCGVGHDDQAGGTRRRALRRMVLGAAALGLLVLGMPFGWVQLAARGHRHAVRDAPSADVVIVLGARVAPGGTRPMPFLAGRLGVAAQLVREGKAKVVLVSGDERGASGDEVAVMTTYLTGDLGVDPSRIVADPRGLDTYDSCARAFDVYGVRRALIVTQGYHLARAVALCRRLGVDASGVRARCDDCRRVTLLKNGAREVLADPKAALDAIRRRPPTVRSPPDPAVAEALARAGVPAT
jgi:vancomycin permeability regulator SanA